MPAVLEDREKRREEDTAAGREALFLPSEFHFLHLLLCVPTGPSPVWGHQHLLPGYHLSLPSRSCPSLSCSPPIHLKFNCKMLKAYCKNKLQLTELFPYRCLERSFLLFHHYKWYCGEYPHVCLFVDRNQKRELPSQECNIFNFARYCQMVFKMVVQVKCRLPSVSEYGSSSGSTSSQNLVLSIFLFVCF